jgi:hypothetical protein
MDLGNKLTSNAAFVILSKIPSSSSKTPGRVFYVLKFCFKSFKFIFFPITDFCVLFCFCLRNCSASRKECEELEADERNLESKISKKQEELERTEKRLKSLESVRPQFMEEAEKLEKELTRYYDIYMEKHRNLDYLEHELDKYHHNEEERMKEHELKLRKMRERLLKEEVDLMRGARGGEGGGGGGGGDEDRYGAPRKDYYGNGYVVSLQFACLALYFIDFKLA